jgi:hypothetical protein
MRHRKQPNIKVKPKFALVVDGENEYWYVQMLQRNENSIGVALKPEIPQKKTLKEQYDRVKELLLDYDKVFWIIDCDVVAAETRITKKGSETPQQELDKYIKTLERDFAERVIIIKNNPCLEYWLLLHFEDTAAHFADCDAARKRLKRYFPTYEKSQAFYTKEGKDIYLQLKPNLPKAVERAIKIAAQSTDQPDGSISEMYLLIQALGLQYT